MPQLSAEMLAARLSKGRAVPVILLVGNDAYLRDACRDQIVQSALDLGARDWGLIRFSAAEDDFAHILGQARTVPMLSSRQVVIVNGLEDFGQRGEAARKGAEDALSEYLDDPAPFTVLLFEAAALDQRLRLAKLLTDKAQVVSADLPEQPEARARVARTIAARIVRERDAAIEPAALDDLVDLCNADGMTMRTEIEKLTTYVGPARMITRQDVAALVVSEKKYSVFDMAEMLASGERDRALAFLDSLLREGEPAPAVVGAMAWMVRKLLELQEMGPDVSEWQAAARLRMRPETVRIALRNARRIPRTQLTQALQALYHADSKLKSAGKEDRWIMDFLVAGLFNAKTARRAG
jgi:DNA polymerase-3 subunit delta